MTWFAQTLTTAAVAFVATNLDDLLVLMLLFSQVPSRFSPHHIFWGRYLGFSALVVLSLPGFFGGLILPQPVIGLLGVVPIIIGLQVWLRQTNDDEMMLMSPVKLPFLSAQVATVAGLTFANGGDNIGIYVSLFAGQTWAELGLTLTVFAVLMAVWYWVAQWLVSHPVVSSRLAQIGERLVPPVLIGLGLWILIEHDTYRLFLR
jgi:cadmium resistance transport/sequestration family protein